MLGRVIVCWRGGAFARGDLVSTIRWWVGGAVSAWGSLGVLCGCGFVLVGSRCLVCVRGFLCLRAGFSCVGLIWGLLLVENIF